MTEISSGYSKGWKAIPKLALTPPAGDAALVSTLDDLYRWSQIMDARDDPRGTIHRADNFTRPFFS